MRKLGRSQRIKGFTLVELITVIVLLSILAAVGSNMLSDSFVSTRMVNASNASESEARYAVERLVREIREVKYDAGNNAYCITTMTTSPPVLVFYMTNGPYSNTCATNADVVTINQSGTALQLNNKTLAENVTGFSLNYQDSNGCTTTKIDNSVGTDCTTVGGVKFVVINLTVKPTDGPSFAQRVRVALRNS